MFTWSLLPVVCIDLVGGAPRRLQSFNFLKRITNDPAVVRGGERAYPISFFPTSFAAPFTISRNCPYNLLYELIFSGDALCSAKDKARVCTRSSIVLSSNRFRRIRKNAWTLSSCSICISHDRNGGGRLINPANRLRWSMSTYAIM